MAFDEDQYLMISGIQHFLFCKRQWALIHIEQQWEENVRTIEGQQLHQKADNPAIKEKRRDKIIVRGMPVHSRSLGVNGVCDVVEFRQSENGISLQGQDDLFIPVPIEYKRGKPKSGNEDIYQMVAQALCLEEMLACTIDRGYIFYGEQRHRITIDITQQQKDEVASVIREMHHYFERKHTPKVKTGNFCKSCSLQHICLPVLMNKQKVSTYIERNIKE